MPPMKQGALRGSPVVPVRLRDKWADILSPTADARAFHPDQVAHLPAPAGRWLCHAIAVGTLLRRRAELRQHGQIKIAGRWWPIRSRQALDPLRGYVWPVRTSVAGLPLLGVDLLADGEAELTHRLLGVVPVVEMQGLDVVRSAAARAASEICWSPATALDPAISWRVTGPDETVASIPIAGETVDVALKTTRDGAVISLTAQRWTRSDDGSWQWRTFGAHVLEEASFGGFTVPSRVVAGYGDDFTGAGAFIRLIVDDLVMH